MKLLFCISIFLCCACISLAEDFKNDLEVILSEDVKQYVSTVIATMVENQSMDTRILKEKIEQQEKKIHLLETEKVKQTSAIQELERNSRIFREKIKLQERKIGVLQDENMRKSFAIEKLETRMDHFEKEMKSRNCSCGGQSDEVYISEKLAHKESKSRKKKYAKNQMSELGSAKLNLGRIRRANTETEVAFFATMTLNEDHLGKDQDIVFDHIVTNIGHAYNANHGTFVAPVPGTYVFSVTLYHQSGVSSAGTWGHVVANGIVVAKLHVNQEQSSQTVIVSLQAGDDVSVQNTETDRGFFGDRYSTFSGFLLYENILVSAVVG